jgi:hypothetical protein
LLGIASFTDEKFSSHRIRFFISIRDVHIAVLCQFFCIDQKNIECSTVPSLIFTNEPAMKHNYNLSWAIFCEDMCWDIDA